MRGLFQINKENSALTRFEAFLGLVDDIDAAFAANDLAIAVPVLQGTQRISDLHGQLLLSGAGLTLRRKSVPRSAGDGGRNWD